MERKDIYSSLHAIYDTLQYLTTRPIDTLFFLILRALNFFSYYGRSRIPKNLSESLPTGLLQNGADLVLMISLTEKGIPFVRVFLVAIARLCQMHN